MTGNGNARDKACIVVPRRRVMSVSPLKKVKRSKIAHGYGNRPGQSEGDTGGKSSREACARASEWKEGRKQTFTVCFRPSFCLPHFPPGERRRTCGVCPSEKSALGRGWGAWGEELRERLSCGKAGPSRASSDRRRPQAVPVATKEATGIDSRDEGFPFPPSPSLFPGLIPARVG